MELCADSSFEVVHCREGPALGRLGVSLAVLWIVVVYASVVGGFTELKKGWALNWYIRIPFLLI